MTRKVKDSDGRSTRWDDHREARRAELVEAAVRAIDTHGPDAPVADIAAEAGVSKPVLYRFFADKAELHAAVGKWGAELVLANLMPALLSDAPPRERTKAAVDAYLSTIELHPQVFLLLVRNPTGDPLAEGKASVAAAMARSLNDGLRSLGVDSGGAEPWAHGLVGLGLSVGEWWLERRTMSRAAVSRYLTAFVWHAFAGIVEEYDVDLGALSEPTTARVTPLRKEKP